MGCINNSFEFFFFFRIPIFIQFLFLTLSRLLYGALLVKMKEKYCNFQHPLDYFDISRRYSLLRVLYHFVHFGLF